MHYELSKEPAGIAYKLLTGLVAPRPIALITSVNGEGQLNAAPFSAYNYLCTHPPIIGIGVANKSGESPDGEKIPKDTAHNILATGEFVVNVVTEDLAEAMNLCSIDFPAEINELEIAKLGTTPSQVVRVPRIREAHAALECRLHSKIAVGNSIIILGEVVSFYIEDKFLDPTGPYVKADELHAIGRMNGLGNYVRTRDAFFTLNRIPYDDWKQKNRS